MNKHLYARNNNIKADATYISRYYNVIVGPMMTISIQNKNIQALPFWGVKYVLK